MKMATSGQYAHCPPREPVSYDVTEQVIKSILEKTRITPLYEKGVFDYVNCKHYSLNTNRQLACAWDTYKKNIESRVIAPFQFPDQRDIHFYNCNIRFLPSLTDHKRATFRKNLKPGPGVDHRGQMPIPQELLMKRTAPKDAKGKKKRTPKTEQKEETSKKEIPT